MKPPRREYRNPPVHEVLLDVQFHRSLDEKVLRELRDRLLDSFPQAEPQNLMQMQVVLGPTGQTLQSSVSQFGGWLFRGSDPGWLLQTGPMGLTLHAVRQGLWPSGEYVGWSAIFRAFHQLHAPLADAYGPLGPKRVGLRYLNRIAVPERSDLSEWFTFTLNAPALLRDVWSFNLRQTWASLEGYADLSATLGLAKIEIEEPRLKEGRQGILFDIDIYNLWVQNAPSYANLPEWFHRAHEAENQVFESCIKDSLRQTFGEI
jgi:uncharacterized protein (TIGR04255 family)